MWLSQVLKVTKSIFRKHELAKYGDIFRPDDAGKGKIEVGLWLKNLYHI